MLVDQLLRGGDATLVLALVVLAHRDDLPAVDAAPGVDLLVDEVGPVHGQLAEHVDPPGPGSEEPDLDAVTGQSRIGRRRGREAAGQEQDRQRQGRRGGSRLDHRVVLLGPGRDPSGAG